MFSLWSSIASVAAETKDSILFTCVSWDKLKISNLFYRSGDTTYIPINIQPMTRPKPSKWNVMRTFELYSMETNQNNEDIYTLVGKSSIPNDTDQVLFFLEEKISKYGLPITILDINDSLSTFPPSSFRFFNFTESPLTVSFDGDIKSLPPRSNKLFKFKVCGEGAFLPLLVKNDQDKVIYETRVIGQINRRNMVFIREPQNKNTGYSVKFLTQCIASKVQAKSSIRTITP